MVVIMTAHCRPEKYPADDDIDAALDIWEITRDDSVPITEQIYKIGRYVAELRKLPSVVPLHADGGPPGVGVSPTPRTAPGGDS
jgi:hypothetical protein